MGVLYGRGSHPSFLGGILVGIGVLYSLVSQDIDGFHWFRWVSCPIYHRLVNPPPPPPPNVILSGFGTGGYGGG